MSAPAPGEIRRRISAARLALPTAEAQHLARLATRRFLELATREIPSFDGVGVALYRAVPSELDLRPLETHLRAAGARLYFPRVLDRQAGTMEFVHTPDADVSSSFGPGAFGIEEPRSELSGLRVEQAQSQIHMVFVPGVAFGEAGERIGLGAGFYDRLLARLPAPLRIALAFDLQLLPTLPQQSWDQPLDWIVTECRESRRQPSFGDRLAQLRAAIIT